MSLTNILNLVDSIGNLLRSEEKKFLQPLGLQPIHLHVLMYLSMCNKYSNNPAALTKYLGNTKGTTSQSINVLETKGYLVKKKSKNDKRIIKLYLTEQANEIIKKLSFEDSEGFFNDRSMEIAENVLTNILKSLQLSNQSIAIARHVLVVRPVHSHSLGFLGPNGLGRVQKWKFNLGACLAEYLRM